MSSAVREAVLNTIGRQQAALDLAIERGNVGLQLIIWRRMTVLEAALSGDGQQAGNREEVGEMAKHYYSIDGKRHLTWILAGKRWCGYDLNGFVRRFESKQAAFDWLNE